MFYPKCGKNFLDHSASRVRSVSKKFLGFISYILFILIFFSLTSGQRLNSTITMVPAKSIAVARVDWTRVRQDQQLKRVVKGDDFANILGQIGVDEANVREFVIFMDLNPTSSGKMGIIASGNFLSAMIFRHLESKGWRSEKFGVRTAYINPSDGSYIFPLKEGTFVAGTQTAVEQTLETLSRPQTGLIHKASFRSIMTTLGTAPPIRFFIGVPEEYQGVANFAFKILTKVISFTGLGIVGMIFDHIGLIQSVGLSIDAGRNSNPVHWIFAMPGKTEAALASGVLNLLKRGASMMAYSDTDKVALKSMRFGNAGNLLSIKMDMPQRIIIP